MLKKLLCIVTVLLPTIIFALPSHCPMPGAEVRVENGRWVIPDGWTAHYQNVIHYSDDYKAEFIFTNAYYNHPTLVGTYPNTIECTYAANSVNRSISSVGDAGALEIFYTGQSSPFPTPPTGGRWVETDQNGYREAICLQFTGGPVSNCPFPQ